jgi:hypothetical protein
MNGAFRRRSTRVPVAAMKAIGRALLVVLFSAVFSLVTRVKSVHAHGEHEIARWAIPGAARPK